MTLKPPKVQPRTFPRGKPRQRQFQVMWGKKARGPAMRHARDGAAAAMNAASRGLVVRGKDEPQELENPDVAWAARAREGVWAPTKDGQRIHIGIECTAGDRAATVVRPSLRVFVGVEVDTDIVAQTTDSGIRL